MTPVQLRWRAWKQERLFTANPPDTMASDRAKLALDEQSFQGLLAAAFTIQEHNARMNGSDPPNGAARAASEAKAADPPPVKPETTPKCSQCGTTLAAAGASCPNCNVPDLRQGEQLQRKWASLWLMSQEQGLGLEARKKPGSDFPLSPADPGRPRLDPPNGRTISSVVAQAEPATPMQTQAADHDLATDESSTHQATHPAAHDVFGGNHDDEWLEERIEWPAEATAEGTEEAVIDEPDDSLPHQEAGEEESAVAESEGAAETEHDGEADESRRGLKNLQVKLRFRRADLYLGISVIVAAVALLWPTPGQQKPQVAPWERMLIAMGVAEEPQPETHFPGDPDLKVWVDPHTALYYCPGDELYGKSPNGHYTTQREAQADRFEPAERSVCIQ